MCSELAELPASSQQVVGRSGHRWLFRCGKRAFALAELLRASDGSDVDFEQKPGAGKSHPIESMAISVGIARQNLSQARSQLNT